MEQLWYENDRNRFFTQTRTFSGFQRMLNSRVGLDRTSRRLLQEQFRGRRLLPDPLLRRCANLYFQHLVVANGGLGNGVSAEILEKVFKPFGDVLDVIMQPNKPYAFVSFVNKHSAAAALQGVHGQPQIIDGRQVFFYLNCIQEGKVMFAACSSASCE